MAAKKKNTVPKPPYLFNPEILGSALDDMDELAPIFKRLYQKLEAAAVVDSETTGKDEGTYSVDNIKQITERAKKGSRRNLSFGEGVGLAEIALQQALKDERDLRFVDCFKGPSKDELKFGEVIENSVARYKEFETDEEVSKFFKSYEVNSRIAFSRSFPSSIHLDTDLERYENFENCAEKREYYSLKSVLDFSFSPISLYTKEQKIHYIENIQKIFHAEWLESLKDDPESLSHLRIDDLVIQFYVDDLYGHFDSAVTSLSYCRERGAVLFLVNPRAILVVRSSGAVDGLSEYIKSDDNFGALYRTSTAIILNEIKKALINNVSYEDSLSDFYLRISSHIHMKPDTKTLDRIRELIPKRLYESGNEPGNNKNDNAVAVAKPDAV